MAQLPFSAEGGKVVKCKVCDKGAVGEYCELHERAHSSLVEGYDVWKKALDISWKEYLSESLKNPNTGLWVKEVAENLLAEEG